MWTVISSLVMAFVVSGTAPAPVPDFSGHWKFSGAKSGALAREAKSNFGAVVFGEECVITQTIDALTLDIVAGGLKVQAVYRLDGKPSTNKSPGQPGLSDITIVSTTQWIGDVLHITTKSESLVDGETVPVESLRKMWLTPSGDLAVERRGNPTRVVSTAWTVYERVKPKV
jgi:hypothetical protein